VTFWLFAKSQIACDVEGHNSEGFVNVAGFSTIPGATAYLEGAEHAWATRLHLNQWAIEVSTRATQIESNSGRRFEQHGWTE